MSAHDIPAGGAQDPDPKPTPRIKGRGTVQPATPAPNTASEGLNLMARSIIRLPRDVDGTFDVYVNGVVQLRDVDFHVQGHDLVFDRPLRKDRISRWRWFLGAWGVGTYRQDDTVDVRYEADGRMRVAHALPIATSDEE